MTAPERIHRRSDRGSAMLLAVILITILGMGATLAWRQLQQTREYVHLGMRDSEARYLAEAGLAWASHRAATEGLPAGATYSEALGSGRFEVDTTQDAEGRLLVQARGIVGEAPAVRAAITYRGNLIRGSNGSYRYDRMERVRR